MVDWDDYDGDGTSDLAVLDPETGQWSIEFVTSGVVWGGGEGDLPAPGDYDGDGDADLAYFDRYTGRWYVRDALTGETIVDGELWGGWGDVPVPGDYDGDGSTDMAMIWPSDQGGTNIWYVNGIRNRTWMVDGWIPIPMDYDGDGTTDLGAFDPDSGKWSIRHLNASVYYFQYWGIPGDTPLVGDFDGDGMADLSIYRYAKGQSWWWIQYSSLPNYYSHFSAQTGDTIAVGATSY